MLPQVSDNFRKTAANFHYEFNMRHLTNVFEGLLKAHPKNFVHGEQLVHLWLHESERVYGDRLVSSPNSNASHFRGSRVATLVPLSCCKLKYVPRLSLANVLSQRMGQPLGAT